MISGWRSRSRRSSGGGSWAAHTSPSTPTCTGRSARSSRRRSPRAASPGRRRSSWPRRSDHRELRVLHGMAHHEPSRRARRAGPGRDHRRGHRDGMRPATVNSRFACGHRLLPGRAAEATGVRPARGARRAPRPAGRPTGGLGGGRAPRVAGSSGAGMRAPRDSTRRAPVHQDQRAAGLPARRRRVLDEDEAHPAVQVLNDARALRRRRGVGPRRGHPLRVESQPARSRRPSRGTAEAGHSRWSASSAARAESARTSRAGEDRGGPRRARGDAARPQAPAPVRERVVVQRVESELRSRASGPGPRRATRVDDPPRGRLAARSARRRGRPTRPASAPAASHTRDRRGQLDGPPQARQRPFPVEGATSSARRGNGQARVVEHGPPGVRPGVVRCGLQASSMAASAGRRISPPGPTEVSGTRCAPAAIAGACGQEPGLDPAPWRGLLEEQRVHDVQTRGRRQVVPGLPRLGSLERPDDRTGRPRGSGAGPRRFPASGSLSRGPALGRTWTGTSGSAR